MEPIKSIEKEAIDPYMFVNGIFHQGYTHVGLGESHDNAILHQFTAHILPNLKRDVGLKHICLEIESETQPNIDNFLRTGNEQDLEKVIASERKMIEQGYPLQGRIDGNYYNIIRVAAEIGINVIAMDSHENIETRDEYMAKHVPREGPTLVYVGSMHLFGGLFGSKFYEVHKNPNHYSIYQMTSQKYPGILEVWKCKVQDSLLSRTSFGLNFEDEKVRSAIIRGQFFGDEVSTLSFVNTFDGIIHHYLNQAKEPNNVD